MLSKTSFNSFSIVVIGYNVSKTITRCIKSVLNLNYPNYEVIYVDDGSSDNSVQLVKKESENIKLVLKENGGIISARKEGLKIAKNDYIIFVDGDDYVDAKILDVFNNVLIKSSQHFDIILSSYYDEDLHGKFNIYNLNNKQQKFIEYEYLDCIMCDTLPHFMFAKCFRKDYLLMSGYLTFENISMGEDLFTNVLLGLHNPIVTVIYNPTYFYCLNDSNMSRRENVKIYEQMSTLELIKEYFVKYQLYECYKDKINFLWITYAFCYVFKPEFSFKFKKKFINKIKPHIKKFYSNNIFKSWGIGGLKKYMFFCMVYLPGIRFFTFIAIKIRYKIKLLCF